MKPWFARIPLPLIALAIVILPMAIAALRVWLSLPLTYGDLLGPSDPDSWLRLTLVRDLLTGGDWYSHAVTRSDAPFGLTVSPWTRPLDVVIALFTLVQFPLHDLSAQLLNTALILPLFWMTLLLLALYRILRILTPLPGAMVTASILIALAIVMRNYFMTGNADHHAMLATVFLWALVAVIDPAPSPRATLLSGLLLGLLVWISPEGLALIAAIYGWYGLLWLLGDKTRARPFPLLALSTALMSAVAVMIERPPTQWLLPIYDSISIVYVVMLSACAAVVALLYALNPRHFGARLCAAAVGLGAVALLIYSFYPLMFHGTMAGVDPYIFSHFLPRITETQPLPGERPLYIVAMLLQPVMAVAALLIMRRKPQAMVASRHCLQLLYLLVATLALYLAQQRFYYYFFPIVALSLAAPLAALFTPDHPAAQNRWPATWLQGREANAQMYRRLPLLLAVLLTPLALFLALPKETTPQSRRIDRCVTHARQLVQGGALNRVGGGQPLTLFTLTDLGSEVLFFTPHRIIASNYHREGRGIRYLWEAKMLTDSRELQRYLAERKVDLLLLCPPPNPPKDSILLRLWQGEALPAWLTRISYPLPPNPPADTDADGKTSTETAYPVLLQVRARTP